MKIVDLSIDIHEGMTTFPVLWHPYVSIKQLGRYHVEGRRSTEIIIGSHTGTHVDAPAHFIENGDLIEDIPLERFYGECYCADFSEFRNGEIVTADVVKRKLSRIKAKKILMHFGWDKNLFSKNYYTEHPFLSEDACDFLVERGTELVGMDTPMPDDPRNGKGSVNDSPNHLILLKSNVVILEYLCNLAGLVNQEFTISALPLKLTNVDGAPVRAVAIVDENDN